MNDKSILNIEAAIHTALHAEIKRVIDEEAKKASEEVVRRIRGKTGAIAGEILRYYNCQMFGTELRITVDFKGLNE